MWGWCMCTYDSYDIVTASSFYLDFYTLSKDQNCYRFWDMKTGCTVINATGIFIPQKAVVFFNGENH